MRVTIEAIVLATSASVNASVACVHRCNVHNRKFGDSRSQVVRTLSAIAKHGHLEMTRTRCKLAAIGSVDRLGDVNHSL